MTTTDDDTINWNTKRTHRFNIILEHEDAAKLLSAAVRREMHPNRFVALLVRLIARDNLINAVLDDDGGNPSARSARRHIAQPTN